MKTIRCILVAAGCLAACSGSNGQSNSNLSGASSMGGNARAGGASGTGRSNATGGTVSTGGPAATGGRTGAPGGTGNIAGSTSQAGNAGTGGTRASGSTAANGCPGTGGPAMVKLPQGYCIDSTEVTRDQYATWLSTTTTMTLTGQDQTNCSWNTTFTPDATCIGDSAVCQGTACGNQPQPCVDWCDAYAYCAGVGKRLCGKIGGGTNLYADYANASLSQWFNACSSNGANAYPYAGTYQATTCNSSDLTKNTTTAAGSLTGCQAQPPYAGVYDLSGNVWEWEDSCNGTGQAALCRIRGGAFINVSSDLTCGNGNYSPRNYVSVNYIGFRCCAP